MNKDRLQSRKLPVIPLRDRVIFPDTIVTVEAERECSVKAMEIAESQDHLVFFCMQKDGSAKLTAENIYTQNSKRLPRFIVTNTLTIT